MAVLREIIERDIKEKRMIAKQVYWIRTRQTATILIGTAIILLMILNYIRLEQQITYQKEVIDMLIENLRIINQSIE